MFSASLWYGVYFILSLIFMFALLCRIQFLTSKNLKMAIMIDLLKADLTLQKMLKKSVHPSKNQPRQANGKFAKKG